jgi:hypothetical protein
MTGHINISHKNADRAILSRRYLNALTFAVIIKLHHTNSVMYDWSLRKVMSTCHCNFIKAKEILDDGLHCGLIKIRNGHLHAGRISDRKGKHAKIHYIDNKGVPVAFLKRDNSDLLQKIHYDKEASEKIREKKLLKMIKCLVDINGINKALSSDKPQTFSDIRKMILKTVILLYIINWRKMYDVCKCQYGMKVHNDIDDRGMESINFLNSGLSYQAIADRLEGIGLSRYQVSNLVKSLIDDGLLTAKKNVVRFLDFSTEEAEGGHRFTLADFVVPNPRKLRNVNMGCHVYLGKGKNTGILFRQMGNIYQVHADVWKNKRGYNPNK